MSLSGPDIRSRAPAGGFCRMISIRPRVRGWSIVGHRNARPPGDPNANRGGAAGARRAREPREVKTQPWLRAHLRLCRRDCRDAFVRQSRISGTLVVKSDDPAAISLLSLEQAGDKSGEFTVDGAEQDHVIEGAEKLLSAFYLSRDMAQKMSAALRAQQKRGDYRDITNSDVLTTRLTDDMRAVSHDKHVSVHFSREIVPPDPPDEPDRSSDSDPLLAKRLAASNCGFEKAEHLPPNIGYLKLNLFAEPGICAPTAIAAMSFLANSDALIIDVRDNRGGAPRMVSLICSYLFDVPTHLDDIYDRQKNTTEQSWTFPYLPAKNFAGKPVYVLTSRKTFSAAEEFGYDLKNLKRATLIGETTGGGAHTVAPHRLDDHFYIEVPFGGFVNPMTGTDWEGTGVVPDIKVAAADALHEALKRAREQTASAKSTR